MKISFVGKPGNSMPKKMSFLENQEIACT